MSKTLIAGAGLIFVLIVVLAVRKQSEFFKQEARFIDQNISGVIIGIRDQRHGEFAISVRRSIQQDTTIFSLSIGRFMDENRIELHDSIYKREQSVDILFFRRDSLGHYKKFTEWKY
jgi:hypothetical protein